MSLLTNKVILHTGSGDGIGWECAKAYATANTIVCKTDNKEILRSKKETLKVEKEQTFQLVNKSVMQKKERN